MRLWRYLIPFFILALAAFFIVRGTRPLLITATVNREVAIDAVPAIVNVSPEYQINLNSEVSGRILSSNLKPGDKVKKGDVLFEIDPILYETDLKRIQDVLDNVRSQNELNFSDQVDANRRKEDLENYERQFASGNYPELEIKRRREEYQMFLEQQKRNELNRERGINDLEFQISQQRKNIAKCTITAPVDAVVSEVFYHPGELVSGGARLAAFYTQAVQVEARVNEEDFSGIKSGLDASVRFLAYGSRLYPAKVEKVLPSADEKTQQYRTYLNVEIDQDMLIPGLSGEASIVRNRQENSLVIPRAALYNDAVFVLKDGRVHRVAVKSGYRGLDSIQILEGLEEGQTVAISDVESLRDGQSVRN